MKASALGTSVAGLMLVVACGSAPDEAQHVSDCPIGGAAGGASSAGAGAGGDYEPAGGTGGSAGESERESGGEGGAHDGDSHQGGAHDGGAGAQGDGDGPVLTPLTSARAAAGALHAAMLVDTDVQLLSTMLTWNAEYALLTSLRRAASANGSALPNPGSPLPGTVQVECPNGGHYLVSWRAATSVATTGAVELSMQFDDCRGLDDPSGSSTLSREAGRISITLAPADATSWRALSVRLGDEQRDHLRELTWKSEGVVVAETTSSFEVTGHFMQAEEFVGDFDYLVTGHRTDRHYYTRGGDPTNTRYSDALTSTCDQLRLSGVREVIAADTRLELSYRSGSIVRVDEVPERTTTAAFSFHDLRLSYLARDSEGNESAQIDGIVSVTYPDEEKGCASGTYELETITPLLDGDTTRGKGGFPQFSQGQLKMNRVALATFMRKQEVTISLGHDPAVSYRDLTSAKSELERQLECFVEF